MKIDKFARHRARKLAVQALYQWQMAKTPLLELDKQFTQDVNHKKVDIHYFQVLIHEIPKQIDALSKHTQPFIDRDPEHIGPVETSILRIATFELQNRPEIPYRVVINEALELSKVFGPEQSHKYVNGILDKVAKTLRATEMGSE